MKKKTGRKWLCEKLVSGRLEQVSKDFMDTQMNKAHSERGRMKESKKHVEKGKKNKFFSP